MSATTDAAAGSSKIPIRTYHNIETFKTIQTIIAEIKEQKYQSNMMTERTMTRIKCLN